MSPLQVKFLSLLYATMFHWVHETDCKMHLYFMCHYKEKNPCSCFLIIYNFVFSERTLVLCKYLKNHTTLHTKQEKYKWIKLERYSWNFTFRVWVFWITLLNWLFMFMFYYARLPYAFQRMAFLESSTLVSGIFFEAANTPIV